MNLVTFIIKIYSLPNLVFVLVL